MVKALLALLLLISPVVCAATPEAPASLKRQLAATPLTGITIPTLVMEETTLGDAIVVLTQQIEKQSKGTLKLQWVYKDIDPAKWKATITLNAKNQTAAKLLNEILAQAKVEAKLEDHAIVLRPAAPAK